MVGERFAFEIWRVPVMLRARARQAAVIQRQYKMAPPTWRITAGFRLAHVERSWQRPAQMRCLVPPSKSARPRVAAESTGIEMPAMRNIRRF